MDSQNKRDELKISITKNPSIITIHKRNYIIFKSVQSFVSKGKTDLYYLIESKHERLIVNLQHFATKETKLCVF